MDGWATILGDRLGPSPFADGWAALSPSSLYCHVLWPCEVPQQLCLIAWQSPASGTVFQQDNVSSKSGIGYNSNKHGRLAVWAWGPCGRSHAALVRRSPAVVLWLPHPAAVSIGCSFLQVPKGCVEENLTQRLPHGRSGPQSTQCRSRAPRRRTKCAPSEIRMSTLGTHSGLPGTS